MGPALICMRASVETAPASRADTHPAPPRHRGQWNVGIRSAKGEDAVPQKPFGRLLGCSERGRSRAAAGLWMFLSAAKRSAKGQGG